MSENHHLSPAVALQGHNELMIALEIINGFICNFSVKKDLKKRSKNHDSRLTKREFRDFVYKVVENMAGTDEFDYFVDFMLNSVEVCIDIKIFWQLQSWHLFLT